MHGHIFIQFGSECRSMHHLVMDYTNNGDLSIRTLKDIPKCKQKNDCCVFQKATLYYFCVLILILRLILPRM